MLSWLLAAVCVVSRFAAASPKPNIIFAMADQMRFDVIAAGGNKFNYTPNLNKLASQGVWFRNMYSSTPTCTPARAAILTGQSPWNHGMIGYGTVAPHYPFEMPRAMDDAGYSTTSFGKDHFGWNASVNEGISHGYEFMQLYDGLGTGLPGGEEFDNYDAWFQSEKPGKDPLATGLDWNTWHGKAYVYDEYYHPTAWVGRKAVSFLQNYTARTKACHEEHVNRVRQTLGPTAHVDTDPRPFFLKVSFHRPHSPYDPPARLLNSTTPDMLPEMHVSPKGGWDERFRGLKGDPAGCGPTDDAWCGLMPTDEAIVGRRAYAASVRFVDEWVGHMMDTLESEGLLDNTWIIWSADHGDGQGDHYHWRKGFPYEFSAHVPLIVRWPNNVSTAVKRGSVLPQVVELRDILPTVLDLGGGVVPPTVKPRDGKSVACLLHDPSGQTCGWREYVDLEHSTCYNETNHWNALTDGELKYVFRAFFPAEQLFNLTADPFELQDLSTDPTYNATLALWRQRMVEQFERENRGPAWVKDGVLQRRVNGQTYSPNYPHYTPEAGGEITMAYALGNGVSNSSQVWTIQREEDCSKGCEMALQYSSPSLCGRFDGHSGVLEACSASSQLFEHTAGAGSTSTLVDKSSGMCLATSTSEQGSSLFVEACDSSNVRQQWLVGLSGKIWQGEFCMTVVDPNGVSEGGLGLPPPQVILPAP